MTSDIAQDRRRVIVAGRTGDSESATVLLHHDEPSVRQAALGALAAGGHLDTGLLVRPLGDDSWTVRRRACQLAGRLAISPGGEDRDENASGENALSAVFNRLVDTLSDREPLVAEAAAWA